MFKNGLSVSSVRRDKEFVAVRLGGRLHLYSCYVSPRRTIAQFQAFLLRLESSIRELEPGSEIVLAGDFNARSAAWGDWVTCLKGTELSSFSDALELVVLNQGSETTFTGRGAGSIVDVTFVSETLCTRAMGWTVIEEENYSDHNSLAFRIVYGVEAPTPSQPNQPTRRWDAAKGINLDLFATGLLLAQWTMKEQPRSEDPNQVALSFDHMVAAACDFSLPPKRAPRTNKPPVPWWTRNLSELRNICTRKKRTVKRAARHNTGTEEGHAERLQNAVTQYKEAKKELKIAIIRSKADCWKEMIQLVDGDPWGKPYKVVLRKLRGPPPASQMEPEMIANVIHGLFPASPAYTGPHIGRQQHPPHVTQVEIETVIQKIGARRTAPGPDGINTQILTAVYRCSPELLMGVVNSCIEAGEFPRDWKRARVVLLWKAERPIEEPSSYRPICLLNDVS